MSSLQAERGAVHILFLIFVLVIALAFGALWFVQLQENEDLVAARNAADQEGDYQADRAAFFKGFYEEVAPLVGGGVPSTPPLTDDAMLDRPPAEAAEVYVSQLQSDLKTLGSRIDDPASSPTTLRDAWDDIINRYQALKGQVKQKDAEIDRLKAEVTTRDETIAKATNDHVAERTRIQEEFEQVRGTMDTQLNELTGESQNLSRQVRETTDAATTAREQHNSELQAVSGEKRELEGQVRQIHSELKIKREKEIPDGKVVGVEPITGQVFIDIGSNDMLRRGTRFKVFEIGKGDTKIHKGWITVIDTKPGMSEARIDESVPGRRVEVEDRVFNPVYDKKGAVRFVFLGELPGKYTREVAERILKRNGATIDEKVGTRTDFLVLGVKENEDADDLTDSDDYKNAVRWGIEIIRARDLSPFLQM